MSGNSRRRMGPSRVDSGDFAFQAEDARKISERMTAPLLPTVHPILLHEAV